MDRVYLPPQGTWNFPTSLGSNDHNPLSQCPGEEINLCWCTAFKFITSSQFSCFRLVSYFLLLLDIAQTAVGHHYFFKNCFILNSLSYYFLLSSSVSLMQGVLFEQLIFTQHHYSGKYTCSKIWPLWNLCSNHRLKTKQHAQNRRSHCI